MPRCRCAPPALPSMSPTSFRSYRLSRPTRLAPDEVVGRVMGPSSNLSLGGPRSHSWTTAGKLVSLSWNPRQAALIARRTIETFPKTLFFGVGRRGRRSPKPTCPPFPLPSTSACNCRRRASDPERNTSACSRGGTCPGNVLSPRIRLRPAAGTEAAAAETGGVHT